MTTELRTLNDDVLKLSEESVDSLFLELARRSQFTFNEGETNEFVQVPIAPASSTYDIITIETLKNAGKRSFEDLERRVFHLVCSDDAASVAWRSQIAKSANLTRATITSTLALLISSQLGITLAIASVIATIILALYYDSAADIAHGLCLRWKKRIDPAS